MEDKIVDIITRARISMLLKAPFFGNLATRLKVTDGTDWCPTAATDGRHMFYNREFFAKLDKKEVEFVVAHEVMHCVYDSMGRCGSRNPKLFNVAADLVINLELHEHRIGKLLDPKTTGIELYFDPKFKGMSTEQVYDIISKDEKYKDMDSFDVHMGIGDGMSEEEKSVLKDEITQAVMQAAKAAGAGNVPASVERMIKDITEPQMDWREILTMQIQSLFKTDFTWSSRSRKSMSSGYYLPGMKPDTTIDVCVAVDTSGSMSDEMLRELLAEIYGIMSQYTNFTVHLWTFDTKVYGYKKFSDDNISELHEYKMKGGGGTDFVANWTFMKGNDINPKKFIMMTDGYPCGSWGDEYYCDTVFLIHGTKSIVAPFGETVYYESM